MTLTKPSNRVPDYLFCRQPDVEAAGGLALAGFLMTRFPKGHAFAKADNDEVTAIVKRLVAEIGEGRMASPAEAIHGMWLDGQTPTDHVADENDPEFAAWAPTRQMLIVKLKPDGGLTVELATPIQH